MKEADLRDRIPSFIKRYKVTSGKGFTLDDHDPADTHSLSSSDRDEAKEWLVKGTEWLAELQSKLYANDKWGILLIFQAMDAAGKDSTIKHVMSGINPQGCQVYSFKRPSSEELDHNYLWRYQKCLPERGRIGIFNRSYYEEVLVVRVHEEILRSQRIPAKLTTKKLWDERLEDIKAMETHLNRNGIIVLKFMLNVSRKEQKKRFLERLDTPAKNWKFEAADLAERKLWKDYMNAYQEAIRATATKNSPWFVVPADNKWFTRLVVAAAVVDALQNLNLRYPTVDKAQRELLAEAKAKLEAEKS